MVRDGSTVEEREVLERGVALEVLAGELHFEEAEVAVQEEAEALR